MKAAFGIKSFAMGEVSPAFLSSYKQEYLTACKKLTNFIVHKDGSISPRRGVSKVFDIPADIKEIKDVAVLKRSDDKLIHFFLGIDSKDRTKVFFKPNIANYPVFLDFSDFNVKTYDSEKFYKTPNDDPLGKYVSVDDSLKSKIDPEKHGFNALSRNNVVKIQNIHERIMVFFEECFPFKIWLSGNSIRVAPFYQGKEDEIWRCFPGSRSVRKEQSIQNMVKTRIPAPSGISDDDFFFPSNRREDEKLFLKIENVNHQTGECEAYLDYNSRGEDDFINLDFYTLKRFLGHPIFFSVGNRQSSGLERNEVTAQGFNFFVIFPYMITEHNLKVFKGHVEVDDAYKVGHPKAKCKIYSFGALNNALVSGRTDNWYASDWVEGFPKMGGNLGGKDFYLTNGGKLSYSKTSEPQVFGEPFKVLLLTSGFRYTLEGGTNLALISLVKEDFQRTVDDVVTPFRTPGLNLFFERVEDETDTIALNISDPATYNLNAINGERANIYNFLVSEIGAFTAAGAQTIGTTDKGVFYWGINPQGNAIQNFLSLSQVSKFITSKEYPVLIDVNNYVYVADDFGELFVVIYNQNNRSFTSAPASPDLDLRNLESGVRFYGNRLLCVDKVKKALYCMNIGIKGLLQGLSEWRFDGYLVERVERLGGRYYFVLRKGDNKGTLNLVEYKDDSYGGSDNPYHDNLHPTSDNRDPVFNADLETAPVNVGKIGGFFDNKARIALNSVGFFLKDVEDLQWRLREEDAWQNLERGHSVKGKIQGNVIVSDPLTEDEDIKPSEDNKPSEVQIIKEIQKGVFRNGDGFYVRMKSTERGRIGGISFNLSAN